jgi:peptidoglycan/xylan/chitin deacetylase (PgdA/CDA1 family)
MSLRPEQRLAYAAAIDRPVLALPDGAKLAIWPVVNVEHWLIDNPMPRQVLSPPTGTALLPDVPNWAWHEYGMRVGFWRFADAFARRGIRPTLSCNASVCLEYPRVAAAARDAGWDFMGHGFHQMPTHRVEDQRAMIFRSVEVIAGFTQAPVLGWLGPGLTETLETPDLLAEAGIRYLGDFPVDDRPARIATTHGPLVALPYPVELNDIPVVMIQHHGEEELGRRAMLAATRLLAEAETSGARVMGIAVHPYISAVPHRIAAFEAMLDSLVALPGVVFRQGRDLLDWYLASGDPA